MLSQSELVTKLDALAAELLRGADTCIEDGRDALALMLQDAADGLLALLDVLPPGGSVASCKEMAPA